MRGVATKFSGLSPKQMKLLKKLLQQRQKQKYGRFDWFFSIALLKLISIHFVTYSSPISIIKFSLLNFSLFHYLSFTSPMKKINVKVFQKYSKLSKNLEKILKSPKMFLNGWWSSTDHHSSSHLLPNKQIRHNQTAKTPHIES